jgi:hypothetical protein
MTNNPIAAKLAEALRKLPLKAFDKDPSTMDAAEFVDHANDFVEAMDAAREALREYDDANGREVGFIAHVGTDKSVIAWEHKDCTQRSSRGSKPKRAR